MKKTLVIALLTLVATPVFADQWLNQQQAQNVCPSVNALTYTRSSWASGMITGEKNGVQFYSGTTPNQARPGNIGRNQQSGLVADVEWRTDISPATISGLHNEIISCYFTYPMVKGYGYRSALIMSNYPLSKK